MKSNELSEQNQMELGNVINVLNQPKAPTLSIMDLGKQLLESAKEGHTNKVHDLMCRGAPFTTDWLGKSALHMAAENNHYETCEVLLRAGISKDSRTKVDRTPLHLAVCNGHEEIVKLLLEQKCDVNARDMLKHTPLHWAVEEDHPNLVKLLLKYGADPYIESKNNETPLTIAHLLQFNDLARLMSTYKYQVNVSIEEQQEATDSLMQEMEKDSLGSFKHSDVDISQDSTSCDDNSSATINLQSNLNSNSQQQNSSTLQLLQEDLAVDDANNFLQSAYACGRQIVVTEFGKQMILKVQNSNATTNTTQTIPSNSMSGKNGDIKQKPVGIIMANSSTPKVLTKSNIVKRITPEELTKLCNEGKVIKTVSNPQNVLTNGGIRFPKYRLMQKVGNSDNTNLSAVKVINKSAISNSSIGPATITTAKKTMVIKSEPPHLTNFTTATTTKTFKPTLSASIPFKSETSDQKMVQIPMPDYLELIKQVSQLKELKERVAQLEEHCEKTSGFIRNNKTTTQH